MSEKRKLYLSAVAVFIFNGTNASINSNLTDMKNVGKGKSLSMEDFPFLMFSED